MQCYFRYDRKTRNVMCIGIGIGDGVVVSSFNKASIRNKIWAVMVMQQAFKILAHATT